MSRQRLSKEVRRRQILDAATECFYTKGYHGSSINDIVSASGMSKGNVYWYFTSKEEIFLAVLEEWSQKALADMTEDIEESGRSIKKMLHLIINRMQSYLHEERSWVLAYLEFTIAAARNENGKVRQELERIFDKFKMNVMEILQASRESGEIANQDLDLESLSQVISLLYDSIMIQGLLRPEHFEMEKNLEMIIKMINGLIDEPATEGIEGVSV